MWDKGAVGVQGGEGATTAKADHVLSCSKFVLYSLEQRWRQRRITIELKREFAVSLVNDQTRT